jgi:uncharacterized protein YciI
MYFVYKLIPPRPTFDRDMNEVEAGVMAEHVGYWTELVENGTAVVFGPVQDPAGTWGMAVVKAEDESEVREVGSRDPAVTSSVARFEVCPMPAAILRSAG